MPDQEGAATCSRAGCRHAARWRIDWRNPRIHAEERVKTWVACDDHRDYLRDFLAARSFPVSVSELPATSAGALR
ncbi:hypothetical protein ACFUTX_06030 [Microbacterium sp. NPDC057407]|uniref:hypothetical protein n=1 Tax=Microbacterium sp. NPDC057407 TaxID=3346120 RepID=UPI003673039F